MRIVGADTETSLILPGNLCPPLVCLTHASRSSWSGALGLDRVLLDARDGASWFLGILKNRDICTVWQNGPYDWAVLVETSQDPQETLDLVFLALREGRLSDIETREKLLLNERGLLFDLEEEGRGIPLYTLVQKYLDIDIRGDKTNPDAWRLRYGELLGIPLGLWPEEAVRYAEEDSTYNLLVYECQQRDAESTGYQDRDFPWLVQDERRKVSKKFALHLMSAWGCRTDPEKVTAISKAVADGMGKIEKLLLDEGLARLKTEKGVVSVSTIRRAVQDRVTLAYACQAIGLDPDEQRKSCLTTDAEVASLCGGVSPLSSCGIGQHTTRCLADLTLRDTLRSIEFRGIPAVWPKKTSPEGGGIRCVVDGLDTTPTTYDPAEPSDRFPEGQVSWSRLTLLGSGDEALVLLGQQGELQKLSSTYVPILKHGLVYPINPQYDEMKASGRSSCKRPNMQNLPTFGLYYLFGPFGYLAPDERSFAKEKGDAGSWTGRRAQAILERHVREGNVVQIRPLGGLRECFVARPGWALLDADIDFAECVAWSQWCHDMFGFSDMGEVINAGEDPHLHLALEFPQLGHLDYAEVVRLKKSGDLLVKKMRQYAKSPGNFGCMGGMGWKTLKEAAIGYETFLTDDEAEMICQAFHRRWRESKRSNDWVNDQLKRTGDAGFTFVQPRSLRRRGGCSYTKGRNQAFQGGTADHADDVLFRLARRCYSKKGSALYGARPWAFSHDEFILEIPYESWSADRTHDAGKELEQVIVDSGKAWFPDVAVRTESALARRWLKDRRTGSEFKRVTDKEGRIIPCD